MSKPLQSANKFLVSQYKALGFSAEESKALAQANEARFKSEEKEAAWVESTGVKYNNKATILWQSWGD